MFMVGAVNKRARLLGAFYNLILLFSSLVFGFIIIEGALWLLNTPPHPETIFEGNAVDKKNGFVLRPNTVSRHSSWEFDTEVSVNEMGFRGEASVKPNTALFAMMLGDSFAQGHGLNQEETMSQHLQSLMDKGAVVNLGVGSYSTYQATNLYHRYLDKFYQPPEYGVLIFYVGNDYYDNRRFMEHLVATGQPLQSSSNGVLVDYGTSVEKDGSYLLWYRDGKEVSRKKNPSFYPPEGYENSYLGWSKLYNLWAWFDSPKSYSCQIPIAIPSLFENSSKLNETTEWSMTKRALDSFLSISKEQGVTPLLVIMPAKYQLTPSLLENAGCDVSQLNVNESVDVLVSYARDKGVRFVDLLAYFRALSTDEQGQLFYQVDSHLTPYGSRKASEAIAEAIQ